MKSEVSKDQKVKYRCLINYEFLRKSVKFENLPESSKKIIIEQTLRQLKYQYLTF